ncbi:heparinase [Methylobacterium sp. J-070]|uniref:heparinase n=1 Tax=Methylobacterium sp. J-070 TaxID=2836650 RepID=UPI001FB965F3|nr:heparinase [Methylobacterium sp. J-070]MCJ2048321.1 heparinase [Methylobacterium sp. J-070]
MHERHALRPASARADAGAPHPAATDHVVGNRNRWSRVVLAFAGLAADQWYEFGACMLCESVEAAAAAKDFAAIGLAFLAEDRSEIDFAHVPGLARTSMDAHGDWLAGPGAGDGARVLPVRRRFYLPDPAAEVAVVIRSWRNTRPFRIIDPEIRPAGPGAAPPADAVLPPAGRLTRDGRIRLGVRPVWFRHGLVPGRGLVVKGQVLARGPSQGALARIVFRDARGGPLPPPYPDTLATLANPAFLDIPVHRQAYRFTLKISPPPQAATLEIGFAVWEAGADLALAGPPDVFLDDDLRLADLADDADPGAGAFLARLLGRLGGSGAEGAAPPASIRPYLDPARLAERPSPLRGFARLRDGRAACVLAEGAVRIAPQPAWTLPEVPDWAADPFRSRAWRLAFQSLAWAGAAAEDPDRGVRAGAVAAAVSWSRANPWGRPADGLSLHPACMALRLEAMLGLLGAATQDPAAGLAVETLGGEVVRHAAALAEILAQHTVAGSLLDVQVAAALLSAGLALPDFPMARHWTDLAATALRGGFAALIGPDGTVAEPSYHRSLELLTLAIALAPALSGRPDLAALAELLDQRLPRVWAGLAALIEPDGALPPFDDAPDHPDRTGWLRRLAASRAWPEAPSAVPGPAGGGPSPSDAGRPGTLAVRRPDDGAGWSAFTADFSEQVHPQDHRDCTAFTFATGGLRWITEGAGRHAVTARAHNVVIPDGREPGAGGAFARAPVRLGAATLHRIETGVHGPDYGHLRAFVLLEDLSGLAVLDRFLAGDRPVSVEGFLHFDPSAAVALDASRRVFCLRGQRQLHVVPHTVSGRLADLAVSRAWAGPGSNHGASGGAVVRYGLSGVRSVAGGVLIAASADSLSRLARAVEDDAFRQAFAD